MPDLRTITGKVTAAIYPVAFSLCASLVLLPPAEGAMMILPLAKTTPAETSRFAAGASGRILSPGPYAGSLAIWGERETVFAAEAPYPYLLIAVPFRGCA